MPDTGLAHAASPCPKHFPKEYGERGGESREQTLRGEAAGGGSPNPNPAGMGTEKGHQGQEDASSWSPHQQTTGLSRINQLVATSSPEHHPAHPASPSRPRTPPASIWGTQVCAELLGGAGRWR